MILIYIQAQRSVHLYSSPKWSENEVASRPLSSIVNIFLTAAMVFFHIAAAVLCVAQVATPLPTNEAAIANNHSFPKTVTIDLGILSKAVALNITEVPSSLPSGVARVRREVIDSESRVLWTDRGFPNSAIGRVVWATGEVCSGTLVGPRHVITAAQCIAPTGISMSFQPAYAGGETYPSSDVSLSVLPPTNPIDCWEDDYAVCEFSPCY